MGEAEWGTEVLCETLKAQKLKKRWQMELPSKKKKNQKRQTYTLDRKSGQFLYRRGNTVNLLRSIKSCSIASLVCCVAYFSLLCSRLRTQPWTCSTGEMFNLLPSHFRCSGLWRGETCCCTLWILPESKLWKISSRFATWSLKLIFPICFSLQLCLVSVHEIKFYINKKQ